MEICNFEIAKKLKEKGFNELCYKYYQKGVLDSDDCWNRYNKGTADRCSAPTISQVLKWLREEKKYHIEFVGNACGYLFIISDVPSEGGTDRYCSDYSGPNDGGTWDKYEDCVLAAIEYVLDNLISK